MPNPEATIRRATAADSATLSRVDASAPLVEGSKSIAIDRAPDDMSQRRSMAFMVMSLFESVATVP